MKGKKYNILFITRNFPPLTGGMERLLYKSYQSLSDDFNCSLIGPTGTNESTMLKQQAYECRFNIIKFIPCAILKAFSITSKNKIDLIFAGSGINALPTMIISKIRNIPYITYTHGLDISYKNPFYQLLFLPAIRSSALIIVNSKYTETVAIKHRIDRKKIHILNPGVDIKTIPDANDNIFKKLDIKKNNILLTVGRLINRKGIAPFIRQCLPEIIKHQPDTMYLIAGEEPGKPGNSSVFTDIQQAINETSLKEHVFFLGKLNDDELTSAYYHADLLIFPVIDDPIDIEGFGMVAIEAAANGTPTIAFSSGGIPDAVKNNVSGILLPPGDYSAMANTIIEYIQNKPDGLTPDSCIKFARRFSWANYKIKISELCNKTISGLRH